MNVFKQAIRHPARSTLFKVQLNFPGNENSQIDSFFCKGAEIPSSKLKSIGMSYMGREVFYPGDRSYDTFPVTIYNDNGYVVRRKLENWCELINTSKTNISEIDWTTVQRDMKVFQLDGQGKVLKEYTMKNAFPTSPGSKIKLDWDSNDRPEEYEVDFVFDYWESPDTSK